MKWRALEAAGTRPGRLSALVKALRAWREQGDTGVPLHVPDADGGGDALAQLSAEVEQLTERIAAQRQALMRAERQQRELLAKVSHDLRTPLASMQGYLELLLLREGELDPVEQRNYLQTAVRQSERLARLVNDLFELARLEAEDMRPAPEDFALAELAQDVLQKFAPESQRRSVQLAVAGLNGSTDALRVHADLALVERVLHNLVENALRHTPTAGHVTIELGRDDARARVVVCDSGEGIDGALLDGLFERYRSDERVGAGGPQGHGGLGLAIARRIVRLHGGDIHAQSRRGQGTRIGFDLPLAPRRANGAPSGSTRT
jgi:signal transduction histidine kinase